MEWETAPEAFGAPLPNAEPEVDPLSGDVSLSQEELTVPSQVAVPPTSAVTGAIKLVNLEQLLQNTSRDPPPPSSNDLGIKTKPLKYSNVSVPTIQTSSILQDPLESSPRRSSATITADFSNRITPKRRKKPIPVTGNVGSYDEVIEIKEEPEDIIEANSIKGMDVTSNSNALPMTNYTPSMPMGDGSEDNSIEDELSELLIMKPKRKTTAPTKRRSQNTRCISLQNSQTVRPLGRPPTSKNQNNLPSSSILPGSNMLLYLTPDGQYAAEPVTSSSVPHLSGRRKQIVPSANNQSNCGDTAGVFIPISNGNVNLQTKLNLHKVPVCDLDSSNEMVTAASETKIINNHNTVQEYFPDLIVENKVTMPDVKSPETSSSAVSKTKPIWPPPVYKRRKLKTKPLPLSGSWTNPNPRPSTSGGMENTAGEDRDPLAGPVKAINLADVSSNPPPRCAKFSRSTQCCMFNDNVTLREAVASQEPTHLKRPMVTPVKRGVKIDVQSKMILYNVYRYFEQRKTAYNLCYSVPDATENATGIKVASLKNIMREAYQTCCKEDPNSLPTFKAPLRRRSRARIIVSNLVIDIALRRYIHDYFLKKKESPGTNYLFHRCTTDGLKRNYRVGINFIRDRMKTLGFMSVRTARRKVFIEAAPIRSWRYKYLNQMKTFWEEKKNIVYTFIVRLRELVLRNDGVPSWVVLDTDDEVNENCKVLTICHAADEKGLIGGALFINVARVDHLRDRKSKWHLEWLERHVLKKIPEGSVLVMAHDRYHQMEASELKPGYDQSKEKIISWLKSRVIGDFVEALPKSVLLEKVINHPVEQKYTVDSLVETYQHIAVHLPSNHRDLNPLEYIWESIRAKWYHKGKLTIAGVSLKDELDVTFKSHAESQLKEAFEKVRQCEDAFRKNDPRLEIAQEIALKKLGGLWSSSSNGPHPDEGPELDIDLKGDDSGSNNGDWVSNGDDSGSKNGDGSGSNDGDDSGSNNGDSGSDSNDHSSDSDSSEGSKSVGSKSDSDSGSDSDDSDDSDTSNSSSSDSDGENPPSKLVNGDKSQEVE